MQHIHPLEPIAVIVLIVILVFMKKKQKAQATKTQAKKTPPAAVASRAKAAREVESPEAVYMSLRRQALGQTPESLSLERQAGEPYGVLMEMGIPNSVITLACFANGDAGIYYKTGGGMKGGKAHESVRNVVQEFLAQAKEALPRMIPTTNHPAPDADRVRFYVLTPEGLFTTETDRYALADSENALSALFYSGQAVVTEMRQVQEQKQQKPGAAAPAPTPVIPSEAEA